MISKNSFHAEFNRELVLQYIKSIKPGYPENHPELIKIEAYEKQLKEKQNQKRAA